MIQILTGNNSFLIRSRLVEIKSKFSEKYGNDGIEEYQAENIPNEQLAPLLTSSSLFSANRLIIIKNLSENKVLSEIFAELIDKVPQETSLVLIEANLDKRTAYYKSLKKQKGFEELKELSENELVKWINKKVESLEAKIDSQAVNYLLHTVGSNQESLNNELEKLAAYDKIISKDTIDYLVEPTSQDLVFQLLEAILSRKTKKAFDILGKMENNHSDVFQIVNLLIWQVHTLSIVASAGDASNSDIAKNAKLNPYVIQKTRRLSVNLSKDKLVQIIEQVAKLDINIKSTSADPWRLIEQTIIAIS